MGELLRFKISGNVTGNDHRCRILTIVIDASVALALAAP